MRQKKRHMRPLVMIAAIVALMAALSAAAVATDFFGLRQALLPQQGKVNVLDENGIVVPGEMEYKDFISLAGFSDTPETRALAEWHEFLDNYDQDGSIIAAIGNNPTAFDKDYGQYQVYTQEMADKLEEIAAKYGLRLHRSIGDIFPGQWDSRIGPFLGESVTAYTGYAYEDGTFAFDGDAVLEDYGLVDYQFRRSVRGTLEQVALNIGDVSQYETWTYQTACGVPVTLALSTDKALILTDLGDSFVTLNVLAGTETPEDDVFSNGPFHKKDLEALAECFDFSVLTPALPLDVENFSELPPDTAYEPPDDIPLETGEPLTEGDDWDMYRLRLRDMTGMEVPAAQGFLRNFFCLVASGYRSSAGDLLAYPRMVVLEEDTYEVKDSEEFMSYYEDVLTEEIQTRLQAWAEMEDGEMMFQITAGLAGTPDGMLWFGPGEDGEIRIYTLQDTDGHGIHGDDPKIGTGE